MSKRIDIKYVLDKKDFDAIIDLYNDSKIKETFGGYREDRLISSEISFLITLNNKPIGFILLVRERNKKDSLSIDMAIKDEYRGMGYGREAIEIFRDEYLNRINESIYAEVNNKNIPAKKIIDKLDNEYIETVNGSEYYMIK